MRKHRLAERLLVDVIGLEWEHVHAEACRWEHVMSEAVERKLIAAARQPDASRPTATRSRGSRAGAAPTKPAAASPTLDPGLQRLDEFARRGGGRVEVRRIAEHVQADSDLMTD